MAVIPITLMGANLGERHTYFNQLVNNAFTEDVPFEYFRDLPEHAAIDRLFKIDLANKCKNLSYILETLKDEDMLYVSRAMKCLWLVQDNHYSKIINPEYLEKNLYPKMLTNASNKMKHWILLNIKDKARCLQFYQYYKGENLDFALKFLPKCPVKFFLQEMKKIPLHKITPHFLKLLCEQSTMAAKVYFKDLLKHRDAEEGYLINMQFLLKTNPNLYFYILETYFLHDYKRLNTEATKYIMKHHRSRFDAKPELYAARILDLSALVKFLSHQEIKDLVTKLARAEYIIDRLTYQFAEPLVKKLDPMERSSFCKEIFQKKAYGPKIKTPPYPIPEHCEGIPVPKCNQCVFAKYDKLMEPPKRVLLRGGGGMMGYRTTLDTLFDEFRFSSFEATFAELSKRIPRESSMETRQNMMLVLVSKSGGRAESAGALLDLLVSRHASEPGPLRAAVVRSLVRRAAAWRLPPPAWAQLLRLAHGLGLDGNAAAPLCREGLHAAVLRHLLQNGDRPPAALWAAFLQQFTTFKDYSLNPDERCRVSSRLPALLLRSGEAEPAAMREYLARLLDVLRGYGISIETYPHAIVAIKALYGRDPEAGRPLLVRLFKARDARRHLLVENFNTIHTDASFLNTLRHDAALLRGAHHFIELLEKPKLRFKGFLRKLAVYFSENGGLQTLYLSRLRKKAGALPHVRLRNATTRLTRKGSALRPSAYLQSDPCEPVLKKPRLDTEDVVDLMYAANWIQVCGPTTLQRYLPSLLARPRLARLVLALRAPRAPGLLAAALPAAAARRPARAAATALRVLRRHTQLPQDWQAFQSLLTILDLKNRTEKFYCALVRLSGLPENIALDYCTSLYQTLSKLEFGSKCGPPYRVALPLIACICDNFNRLDAVFIRNVLLDFLNKDFTLDKINFYPDDDVLYVVACNYEGSGFDYRMCPREDAKLYFYRKYVAICMKIIALFLLNSNSHSITDQNICRVFLNKIGKYWLQPNVSSSSCGPWYHNSAYFTSFLENLCEEVISDPSSQKLCLPVLKTIDTFCNKYVPIDKNFAVNYDVKLTMLYCEAVQQTMPPNPPGLYRTRQQKRLLPPDTTEFVYGKLIAKDVENLISANFPSIRTFYCTALLSYLRTHKFSTGGFSKIIEGLLYDKAKVNGVLVGVYLYQNYHDQNCMKRNLYASLKEIEEVAFFLNCASAYL